MSLPPADATDARARCASLLRAGEALAARPVADVLAVLDRVTARWRDPADPARRDAERALADRHRVPVAAIARILDAGFGGWTGAALAGRLSDELGDARALDGFIGPDGRRRTACGPRLAVVLASRGVPTTPVGDVIDLLSVKSPVWLKPASGADDLVARFASTLREADPGVGGAVEVAGWPRGSSAGTAALEAADLVVATGRAETLAELGRIVQATTRLVLHGPRLSAAILPREALAADPDSCVAALADDVAFAGQVGCLSPVVAWVERPAAAELESLARAVQRACEERWPAGPRSGAEPAERATWSEWRARATIERAAAGSGGVVGGAENAWSVEWRLDSVSAAPPPAPRILVLSAIESTQVALELCLRERGRIAALGIAGPGRGEDELEVALARAGVERIAPLGRMQRPPVGWRRDGRPTLADLVRWVDQER